MTVAASVNFIFVFSLFVFLETEWILCILGSEFLQIDAKELVKFFAGK